MCHDNPVFQNISCYCLSYQRSGNFHAIAISKHLMLLFIHIDGTEHTYIIIISKHLMLLFIELRVFTVDGISKISKHLMLLFIDDSIHGITNRREFQNISCYCLSLAFPRFLVSPLPFFPLYFLYFSIFYQPTSLSWTALLIIP